MNDNKRLSRIYEIDLLELIKVLWSKALVILLCAVIFAGLSGVYTRFCITPLYESNTKMYVLAQQDSNYLTTSDLQASTFLTYDYAEIIKSRTVAQGVIDELGLDISVDTMLSKIAVTTDDDTRIIGIYVSDPDPVEARKEANAVREQAAEHILDVMNSEAVNVVDEADLPVYPYNIHMAKNLVMGAAVGFFLAACVIVIRWLMDDTIKTTDDIEKYLGISVLGAIPKTGSHSKKSSNHKKRSGNGRGGK